MAKRYTDTKKWGDDWYLSLSNDYRVVWQWLLDNCDHGGFCKRSMTLLNMICRTQITEDELLREMQGRVLVYGDNWFIPKFIKFQYGTLYSNKPAILSVVKLLFDQKATHIIPESFGIDYIIKADSYRNHCELIKDKDKDKVKDKVKDKDKDCIIEGESEKKPIASFSLFYDELKRQRNTMNDLLRMDIAKEMNEHYKGEQINSVTSLVETWLNNR